MTNNYASNGNGNKHREKPQDSTKYPAVEVPYNGKLPLPRNRNNLPANTRETKDLVYRKSKKNKEIY